MKTFRSLESVFLGVMGFALFLFVGLSFASIGPGHVQAARAGTGEVACTPADVEGPAVRGTSGSEQSTRAAQAQRGAS